jgi:hypothetical protein
MYQAMVEARFARAVSYDEISPFIDQRYNYPEFTSSFSRKDFEDEFDQAHDALIRHLSEVGLVVKGSGEGDFSLYRYVDLNRGITVVLQGEAAFSPATVPAVLSALEELPADYVIGFDAHPAYVCVFRDGRVLGYEPEPSNDALARLGFPS